MHRGSKWRNGCASRTTCLTGGLPRNLGGEHDEQPMVERNDAESVQLCGTTAERHATPDWWAAREPGQRRAHRRVAHARRAAIEVRSHELGKALRARAQCGRTLPVATNFLEHVVRGTLAIDGFGAGSVVRRSQDWPCYGDPCPPDARAGRSSAATICSTASPSALRPARGRDSARLGPRPHRDGPSPSRCLSRLFAAAARGARPTAPPACGR
jgi:hypothetical protein